MPIQKVAISSAALRLPQSHTFGAGSRFLDNSHTEPQLNKNEPLDTHYRLKVWAVVKGGPHALPVSQYVVRVTGSKVRLICERVDALSRFNLVIQTQDRSQEKSPRSPQPESHEVLELEGWSGASNKDSIHERRQFRRYHLLSPGAGRLSGW